MRAQLKMAETIIVMIVFFFLLAFGMIFYAKFQRSITKDTGHEKFGMFAVQVAQRIESLPEIQCTIEGATDYDCVDIYKLQAFASSSKENRGIYDKIMPNTRVSAISTYPMPGQWQLYDRVQQQNGSMINFTLPVALLNPIDETYSFGLLIVEVYQ